MSETGHKVRSRRTASGIPIVPALDGFRAYALLAVVVLHLLGASGALLALDGTDASTVVWGVFGNVIDAFFIISGFGLFLAVVSRRGELGSLADYAIGRAARLLPAYWLSLVAILVLIAIVPPDPDRIIRTVEGFPSARDITVHLAAGQMPARLFDGGFPVGFGINGPLWMISVIVGFYVVFPLIARPYYHHPLLGLATAAVITVAWREAAVHATGVFESIEGGTVPGWILVLIVTDQLPGWAFSFALGMTGAWAYVRLQESGRTAETTRRAALAAAGGLVVCLACAYLYGKEAARAGGALSGSTARTDTALTLAYTAGRGVLMAGIALGPLWMQRPFANRLTSRLAELSYATYLIHVPIAIYVGVMLLDLPGAGSLGDVAVWFAVVIPLSLAYAALSVRLVERPARRWARRRRSRRLAPSGELAGSPAPP